MRTPSTLLLLTSLVWAGGADQAVRLLEEGQPEKAKQTAERLAKEDPTNIDAWLALADAHVALGEPGEAWGTLENAIEKNREVMGATDPAEAAPGTIRALYAESIEANSVHGSDAPETAATEISFFFSEDEIVG